MRSTLKKAAVLVAGAAAFAMFAGTAQADPPNSPTFKPARADIVGVGSDTTQDVLQTLGELYNAKTPTPAAKVYSWHATGYSPIIPKTDAPEIVRPNGSSAGITALTADGDAHNIDYARSSRLPKATDTGAFLEFARDTVTYATATVSNVPTTLTTLQLNVLYSATAGSPECNYTAYIPQGNSGTRAFFLASIGVATPGSCVKDTFNGTAVQEHDPSPLIGDPQAIVPFSVGRAVGKVGIKVNTVDDSVRPAGLPANVTARVDPATGQTVETGGVVAYDRPLFNVIRKADKSVAKFSAFFGPLGFICTNTGAKNAVKAAGFRLSPNCGVDRN